MSQHVDPARIAWWAGGLWLVLALPPTRAWFEGAMALHMLAQLPLLAGIGWCLGAAWMRTGPDGTAARTLRLAQSCNAGGATGIIAASFISVLWMLPRLLDLARLDPVLDAFKFVSMPVAGLALALSWPRLPAIARGVVHVEAIAMLLRFGWGYVAADERLCLAYLAVDQQRTGELLLWLGAAYAIAVAWRPVFGAASPARAT